MFINLSSDILSELSIKNEGSTKTKSGAISVLTGEHTGRSPNAKRYVIDENTVNIDWNSNQKISKTEFDVYWGLFQEFYANNYSKLYGQTVTAVRDKRRSLNVNIYTEFAKHALFSRNMFMPRPEGPVNDGYQVYHFPSLLKKPTVLISITDRKILISGTSYSGEIKKSVFSVLNYHLPAVGELPMHCSVNVDKDRKNPAIFFGLSGTGKTTLSSDESRILIGDDEHAWTSDGLTNFEGGCYAKTIKLSKEDEPQIWNACQKPNAILENVVLVDGIPDFDNSMHTENTRASYPTSHIEGADEVGYVDEHPKNIIMLTCDAFGVLPAVMKLSPEEAVQQFLLGYTAKVAGTEKGVTEPQATFSPCFGAPFMPLPCNDYADILKTKVIKHDVQCWLVNTGWAGGSFGTGSRMPIKTTRLIIDKILNGTLLNCTTTKHEYTGFTVPLDEEIGKNVLFPEKSWANIKEYEEKVNYLMKLFAKKRNINIDK